MKIERLKSFVLLSLVIMSFVLTTRIWFNISIEGLFVMPTNKPNQTAASYDKENLLKPSKLVVHTGLNHNLVFNNNRDKEYYNFIMINVKDVLKDWLANNQNYTQDNLAVSKLEKIRTNKSVELIFENSMELANIKSLLGIEKNSWGDIKAVNSIIIAPYDGKLYMVDESKGSIYEFKAAQMSTMLKGVIAEIEKRNDFAYVFLNEFNDDGLKLYGDYSIVPVSITSMPILSVKREIEADTKLPTEIADFFDDKARSSISSMKDADGSITFTDREEATVTLDDDGVLEYYKYNVNPDNSKSNDLNEAINIAIQYVSQHIGFTHDFYLAGVKSVNQGARTSYTIRFNYKYDGMPVINNLGISKGAIEVEILGQEVKRYKRNVRIIEEPGTSVKIKSAEDILNIVWGDLSRLLNETKSENIVKLNDLYLAYVERNSVLIPVWVVDVNTSNGIKNKRYIIAAEEGDIGFILDEQ